MKLIDKCSEATFRGVRDVNKVHCISNIVYDFLSNIHKEIGVFHLHVVFILFLELQQNVTNKRKSNSHLLTFWVVEE